MTNKQHSKDVDSYDRRASCNRVLCSRAVKRLAGNVHSQRAKATCRKFIMHRPTPAHQTMDLPITKDANRIPSGKTIIIIITTVYF